MDLSSPSIQLGILISELLLLYIIGRRITNRLYGLFFLFFRNQHIAFVLLAALTLPGTILHEISHLLVAELLRVQTGAISFEPKMEKLPNGKQHLTYGSLMIGKSDPLRRYTIGFAPIFGGLSMLTGLITLFHYLLPFATTFYVKAGLVGLFCYLIFTISITMFSSREDLSGFAAFGLSLGVLGTLAYSAGLRINLTGHILVAATTSLNQLVWVLGIVLGIDLIFFFVTQALLLMLQKVFKVVLRVE